MVNRDSATHAKPVECEDDMIYIDTHYFNIVKLDDRDRTDFLRILTRIVGLVDDVQTVISSRGLDQSQEDGMSRHYSP